MKKLLVQALTAAVLTLGSAAQAAYVLKFEGVTFTYDRVDNDTFTLLIEDALSSTGTWAQATALDNFAFKGVGSGFTGATITGPGNWAYSVRELNANGCAGGGSGGICFDATTPVALSDHMFFTVDLTGASLLVDPDPHLKVRFVNANGRKTGDLLSADLLPAAGGTDDELPVVPTAQSVPEPASWALAGLALVAAAWRPRRRRNTAAN